MTQTPLEQEEAAATVAAGADLETPSPEPAEAKSYRAEPWVEPAGSRPPAGSTAGEAGAGDRSLGARLARAPLVGLGVLAGGALVGAGATLMLARSARRRHPLSHARRMLGRL